MEKRIALVIGNSLYRQAPSLRTAENDAEALSQAFERLGFDVKRYLNVGQQDLRRALRNFSTAVEEADTAAIYFSGHGIGVNGSNYLIPVDARIDSIRDVAFEGVSLDLILFAVERAKKLGLVMLDANFNNPFYTRLSHERNGHSIELGFQAIEPPSNVLVAYSGETHPDKFGQNSPFATAIISHIEQPGENVLRIFREVRDSVLAETGGLQIPHLYGSLHAKKIYLRAPLGTVAPEGEYPWAMGSHTYVWEAWNDAPSRRYQLSDRLWQGLIIGVLVATYALGIWRGTISFELLAGAVIACGFLNLLRASREGN